MKIRETIRWDNGELRIIRDAYRWANFNGRWTKRIEEEKPREMKVMSRLHDNDWLNYEDILIGLDQWKQIRDEMEARIEEYQRISKGEASMFVSPEHNKMTVREGGIAVAEVPLVLDEKRLASDMILTWEQGLEQVKRLVNMLYIASKSVRSAPTDDELEDTDNDDWLNLPEDTFIVRR